jgi:hypothetical protein
MTGSPRKQPRWIGHVNLQWTYSQSQHDRSFQSQQDRCNVGIHFHPVTINEISTMRGVHLHSHSKCPNRQVLFVHLPKTNGLPLHDKSLLFFGPTSLECFGFTDTNTDTDQGIFQLQILLLSHIRCHSKLGLLIRILASRKTTTWYHQHSQRPIHLFPQYLPVICWAVLDYEHMEIYLLPSRGD